MLVEHDGTGRWIVEIDYERHDKCVDARWRETKQNPIYASREEAEAAIAAIPLEERTGYETAFKAVEVACDLCELGEEKYPESKSYGLLADRLSVDVETSWPTAEISDGRFGVRVPLGDLGDIRMRWPFHFCPACGRHIG